MPEISRRLRDAADAVAESADSADGARALVRLGRLLEAAGGAGPAPAPPPLPTDPRPVGIWEPQPCAAGVRFVRPPSPRERASLWASIGSLEPKGRSKRVVLVGESVARGFFFDPHFNPALVLRNMLRVAASGGDVEVLDLARTDLTLDQLVDLVGAAVQLKPDAVVVLAGNNWQPTVGLPRAGFRALADRLRAGGWAEVKAGLEALLRDRVREALGALGGLARAHQFKLIVVLPEFNLADWRTDAANPPLLDGPATAEWHDLRAAAERSLVAGEVSRVRSLGARLIELDGGTTAVGYNLLAAAARRAGAISDARRHLEAARDTAVCWPNGPDTPRCFTAAQEVVRGEAAKGGFLLVDLPHVFAGQLGDSLPDRRHFLDYCHFTVHGAHLAMAAVARVVVAALFRLPVPAGELTAARTPVAPRVEGEAHLLAAIHNANWGQPADLVRWHCDQALEYAPEVRRLLSLWLDFHVRRAPRALCRAFDEFCQLGGVSAVNLLFDSDRPTGDSFLNATLIGAVTAALDSRGDGSAVRAAERLLCDEHAVDDRSIDLLSAAYAVDTYHDPLVQSDRAYYRAGELASGFKLVCRRPQPVRLFVTYRTPPGAAGRSITARVGGADIGHAPASAKWMTAEFVVPAESLRPGITTIEIHWPAPDGDLLARRGRVIEALENAEVVGVGPLYGAIHALWAEAVAE